MVLLTQHGHRVPQVGKAYIRDVVIHEEHTIPAKHAGEDQAEIALRAEIGVASSARFREGADLIRAGSGEFKPPMAVIGGQVERDGPIKAPGLEPLLDVVDVCLAAAQYHE